MLPYKPKQHLFRVTILKFALLLILLTLSMLGGIPLHAGNATAKQQIVLVTTKPLDEPATKFLQLVYAEAFRRLGIELVVESYPAKRASILSAAGKVGGELSRVFSYGDTYPTLVRIEEPHWHSGFLAIAAGPAIQLEGWKSLKDAAYTVIYRRGIVGIESNLSHVVRAEQLVKVASITNGYRMVLLGRAEIMVVGEVSGLSVLHSDEFKDSRLRVAGILDYFTSHVFLHEKHNALVPELTQALKAMKAEGLLVNYAKIVHLHKYITNNGG